MNTENNKNKSNNTCNKLPLGVEHNPSFPYILRIISGTALTSKWFFLPISISCHIKLPNTSDRLPEQLHRYDTERAEKGLRSLGRRKAAEGKPSLVKLRIFHSSQADSFLSVTTL